LLPAPAEKLGVAVVEWGPAEGDQQSLIDGERQARLARLRSAIAQTRAIAGPYAALRVLQVDPRSRVPERRYTFTPYLK
jgi:protein ImuB